MSALFVDLKIEKLSTQDRLQLVGDIWDSVADEVEKTKLTPAQCDEVDRRLAAHRENPGAAVPWEQVEREALARLQK